MQSCRWVITLNNYSDDDIIRFEQIGNNVGSNGVVYFVYGREVGANGTPHLQAFIVFGARKRLRSVKAILGERCHLEPARGTSAEASDYCKKDGAFLEFGALPQQGRARTPGVPEFCDWVRSQYELTGVQVNEREMAGAFPGLYLRYGSRLGVLASYVVPTMVLEEAPLNDWQQELERLVMAEADDRTVRFYVDVDGGKGKSFFCRHMLTTYPGLVQVLSVGKRDDLAHAIEKDKRIFLFNIPRGGIEMLQYGILEGLKDRMIFSPKYNSITKILNHHVHVVVFCNENPDMGKMSADRYLIKHLD
jgi:Putative viral replication protein